MIIDKKAFEALGIYWHEVCFIGTSTKSIDEVGKYLESVVSRPTAEKHLKNIQNGESIWLKVANGMVEVNREELLDVIEALQKVITLHNTGPCITKDSLSQVQTSNQSLKTENAELKKQLKTQTDLVDSLIQEKKTLEEKLFTEQKAHEQQLAQMEELHAEELKKEKQTIRRLRREKGKIPLQTHTLILTSQEVYPKEEDEKSTEIHTATEIPVPKPEKTNILSKFNYKYRITREALTEAVLNSKIIRLLKKHNKEKFKSDNELVKELLGSKEYTNQQKMALYATFADYRSSDFEQLLNFAGDSNLDADLVIMWAESLGDKIDYLQMKNALRQFAKTSEYQQKHKLAKELLLGKWYVEYEVDGKPTVFRLVSEDDLNNIKELLSLPEQAFTYTILQEEEKTAESKPVKEEKPKPSIKERAKAISDKFKAPDFVKTMPVKKEDLKNEQVG